MKEYYFLFALAFLWTLAATIQDIKKREIANWLNFSLIAFALVYRAFYSLHTANYNFFFLGILGFIIFFLFAHGLYYSKAFAGGDAKLLMGFGVILPYSNYLSLLYFPFLFIFLLFSVGAVYSLLYSIFIAANNKKTFKKQFVQLIKKYKYFLLTLFVLSAIISSTAKLTALKLLFPLALIIFLAYIYTKAIDTCMIYLVSPKKLTEGDWLVRDIFLKNKTIKKTVHGLSLNDIKLLKKSKKKVLIKTGIPFTPAFLLALITTVSFFLVSEVSPEQVFSSLFSQSFSLS